MNFVEIKIIYSIAFYFGSVF